MRYIVALFLLCACGTTQTRHLKVNVVAEPYSLDPRRARDLQSQTMAKMFFEGLVRINPKDQPELALAEKVEVSKDGFVYVFDLRKAVWSNGDPVTAGDFVHAWRQVLSPDFPSDQAFQLYVLKNAKAAKQGKVKIEEIGVKEDNGKLVVELENPTPYFLELLAMPVFFPVNAKLDQQNPNWAQDKKSYVSNGPFILDEWRHSDALLVKKNPQYWDAPSVKLGEIELVMVGEETEFKMYEKKQLDWAGSPLSILPLSSLPQLKNKQALNQKPFLATYFFRLNTEKAPFDDIRVRHAFALALNRQEIVEHVTQGGQMPATGLVPESMGLQSQPYFTDGDIDGAKAILSTVDFSDTGPIKLLYISNERNHLIAQAVQQQWKTALGIEVELEPVERKIYFERISRKDFQISSGSWTADFNDPINFLEVFKYRSNGSNNTFWEDDRYAALLDQAMQAADPQQRKHLFQASEEILMEAMPIIPLFYYTMLYVKNDRVQNVVVSALGSIDFKWAYLDK